MIDPGTKKITRRLSARHSTPSCALTIDVEDWFHAANLGIPRGRWDGMPSRVERNVTRILELLSHHDTLATFFVLGWVADRCPEMVKQIHTHGHEVASHGYWHRPVHRSSAKAFADDLQRSIRAIEQAGVCRPIGYRAPSYSIDARVPWAFNVIQDQGFLYDSSIYPARAIHGRYGMAGGQLRPHLVRPGLWEFPLPTLSILGRRFPAATGGYLRSFPLVLTVWAIEQNVRRGIPVVVNVHPWELDQEQPRINAPIRKKVLHYTGLRSTFRKLEHLVRRFEFGRLGDLLPVPNKGRVVKNARWPRQRVAPPPSITPPAQEPAREPSAHMLTRSDLSD